MRQWIGSALVQIIICRPFGAKPLSKPMLVYCQLNPYKQTSVEFWSKYKTFHSRKIHIKISSAKWRPFCPGGGGGNKSRCHFHTNTRVVSWSDRSKLMTWDEFIAGLLTTWLEGLGRKAKTKLLSILQGNYCVTMETNEETNITWEHLVSRTHLTLTFLKPFLLI